MPLESDGVSQVSKLTCSNGLNFSLTDEYHDILGANLPSTLSFTGTPTIANNNNDNNNTNNSSNNNNNKNNNNQQYQKLSKWFQTMWLANIDFCMLFHRAIIAPLAGMYSCRGFIFSFCILGFAKREHLQNIIRMCFRGVFGAIRGHFGFVNVPVL